MKDQENDGAVTQEVEAFEKLLKEAVDTNFANISGEFAKQLAELDQEAMKSFFKYLGPALAKKDDLELEIALSNLKASLKLSGGLITALRKQIQVIREFNKNQSKDTSTSTLSPEKELEVKKLFAAPLLECDDLLARVAVKLQELGLAGVEREAKILYLALTSRVLPRPVSVIVKGPSSAGKSFLVDRVLKLFPETAYYALTAMSEKALAYSEEPLVHRFLIIFEAAGVKNEFTLYLLRTLISEGELSYKTLVKTESGWKPRLLKVEGPIGLIVTTTKPLLHHENETRMLSLEIDASPEQTRAVLLASARMEEPRLVPLKSFKAYQRVLELERPDVVVPFAKPIAKKCDNTALRLRRDLPLILTLIKAHAILHASQRERDDKGRVIATVEDYRVVHALVSDLIAVGTGKKVAENIRQTVDAVIKMVETDQFKNGVKVKDIAEFLGVDNSTASRNVKTAIKAEYLENRGVGNRKQIFPGESLPANRAVLPTPDSLNESEEEGEK